MTAGGRIATYLVAVVLGALLGSAAAAVAHQAPRVCCRVRLPDQGDTIRIATICANVVAKDSLGAVRVTR